MKLPLRPPIAPMLARLEGALPQGEGWLYEPKWDGFRALAFRGRGATVLQSRNGQPLDRYFPELQEPLTEALPEGVFDGEIIVQTGSSLDFEALLQRIHPARSRIERLARATPASFAVFDVLAVGDSDLRARPFAERRRRLERIARRPGEVFATPQTDRLDVALRWYRELESQGIEGVIAKRADQPYLAGERAMIKVKHARTADCVIGGYRLSSKGAGIGSLLLGAWDGAGELPYLGFTSSLAAATRREALTRLKPLETARNPFRPDRSPGGPSRWSRGRELAWIAVEPKPVCEVVYDSLLSGRFRHAAHFLRWRPDKRPEECREATLRQEARATSGPPTHVPT
ncbi:MAG: ATP-dependent DNA ligase [Deltaproteobacteria bacterium]|nr:ATP-dependent DNA ligase [Deltaproteobacteria bacterium]